MRTSIAGGAPGALLLAVVLSARAVWALGSQAAADALFRDGVALAQEGKYVEAIDKFAASYALDPARGTLQGLAMAEERAGRVASAYAHFRELADLARKAQDADRERIARERAASLERRVPHVTIAVEGGLPAGAEVTIDERTVPAAALGTSLPMDPGKHEVRAVTREGRTFARTLTIAEGAAERVDLRWEGPPPDGPRPAPAIRPAGHPTQTAESRAGAEAPRPSGGLRVAGLAVGGAGIVAAGAGAIFLVGAARTYEDLEQSCPQHKCPAYGDMDGAIEGGKSQERWGRVLVVGGAAAVTAGVVMFVAGGPAGSKPPSAAWVRPFVGPGFAGAAGRF